MPTCTACQASVRDGARFCTRCGSAMNAIPDAPASSSEPATEPPEVLPSAIPARIAPRVHSRRPADRSTVATWALITGVAPLVLSVVGNLMASELGVIALGRIENGEPEGAWAAVFVVLAVMFVGNAVLLTVCGITGTRAIRETANGVTRGRALAVAGLAAGGVNLVLWVAGLVVTVGGLNAVLS